jgi:hypothetical protein
MADPPSASAAAEADVETSSITVPCSRSSLSFHLAPPCLCEHPNSVGCSTMANSKGAHTSHQGSGFGAKELSSQPKIKHGKNKNILSTSSDRSTMRCGCEFMYHIHPNHCIRAATRVCENHHRRPLYCHTTTPPSNASSYFIVLSLSKAKHDALKRWLLPSAWL